MTSLVAKPYRHQPASGNLPDVWICGDCKETRTSFKAMILHLAVVHRVRPVDTEEQHEAIRWLVRNGYLKEAANGQ
jgi:hypothetical protein